MRPARQFLRIVVPVLVLLPALAVAAGWCAAPAFLHPPTRPLTPELVRRTDLVFAAVNAGRQDFNVRAADGAMLRGWKVRAAKPNGTWVLAFHGVADNRTGIVEQSKILLGAGYDVVMMDARAHGQSEGEMATYGWLERRDTSSVLDALVATEHPAHIYALGESMGAGIALQSAAEDPRLEAVVAEASFASLREASYDYAGLERSPLLGKTVFAPGAWMMLHRGQRLAGFPASEVSPQQAVRSRAFPVLLICDGRDRTLPCRHTEKIYAAARGPKSLWMVAGAFHTGAFGTEPAEFARRVLRFFADPNADPAPFEQRTSETRPPGASEQAAR